MKTTELEVNSSRDIVEARRIAREFAESLGLGLADQTRLATAISELTRNAVQYAHGGLFTLTDNSDANLIALHISVEDHGPGMADIDLCLRDGYTTSGGLGAGLPGVKRLLNDMSIKSTAGYTKVSGTLSRERHFVNGR